MIGRSGVRSALRRGIRSLGYDIIRFSATDSIDFRRRLFLGTHGIDTVLDVGANTGQYGRSLREAGYSGRIISYEPIPAAFEQLRRRAMADPRWLCEQLALGASDVEIPLNISRNSVSSSILPTLESLVIVEPRAKYVGSVVVPLRRLDSVVGRHLAEADRIWLKLDVQGYERDVLDGAEEALGRTQVVEAELSLTPLYDGQVLYRQMIDHLESLGFMLATLDRGFTDPKTGQVLQVDGIFVRRSRSGTI